MTFASVYTVFLVVVVVWSAFWLVRFQIAEHRNRSAAPVPMVERLARPAPTARPPGPVRGRAEAIADWATQQHPVGCVCQPCLDQLDAELMAILRERGPQ